MAVFIILALVLCIAVLVLLLRPMWRESRAVAVGIGVVALSSVALMYQLIGTPQALDPAVRQAPQTLSAAVAQLEAALQRDPRQAEGWALLAQSYQQMGDTVKARDAFGQAAALLPDNADLITEAAQARAQADPARRFDTQAQQLLQHALQLNPNHQRARWFLGVAQRQSGQNAAAAATWEPLLALVDASTAASLRKEINVARHQAGLTALPDAPVATANPALLTVTVSLDPNLAKRVRLASNATVFLIARQPGGSPMPVAAQKHAITELPFTATLSDTDSPMPSLKLSQVQTVELVARISSDGSADHVDASLTSKPIRVTLPAKQPVTLVIGAP